MRLWLAMAMVGLACRLPVGLQAADAGLINLDGAIGPATASYIARAINLAGERSNVCLIVQLDTPGGLLDSTKDIVQKMYDSKVPIVVYVAPSTARAGSAGVFLTIAADIAAMAPHARLGAAHPVSLGPTGEIEKTDDTMKKKVENDTAAFAESIADKRHRNAEWARSAVIESASITAEKALELNVIDLIAKDVPDLLAKIDGREVNEAKLHTANAAVVKIPMTARENFLQMVLRPEVMFILMLVVMYVIVRTGRGATLSAARFAVITTAVLAQYHPTP